MSKVLVTVQDHNEKVQVKGISCLSSDTTHVIIIDATGKEIATLKVSNDGENIELYCGNEQIFEGSKLKS